MSIKDIFYWVVNVDLMPEIKIVLVVILSTTLFFVLAGVAAYIGEFIKFCKQAYAQGKNGSASKFIFQSFFASIKKRPDVFISWLLILLPLLFIIFSAYI